MKEDHHPDEAPAEAHWHTIRRTKRRPQAAHANSHVTEDYEKRVVSVRLALRSASPSPRQRIAEGARRRRSGGGPGEGCARRPVVTSLYLHAVGAGIPVAVPRLAR
jgi:hypothetical protein